MEKRGQANIIVTVLVVLIAIVGSITNLFNIAPTYNFNDTLVWLFDNPAPQHINYYISGSALGIKGKWALQNWILENASQEGKIINI